MCAETVTPRELGPEPPLTFFKELLGWFDKYSRLKRFMATRRAIRDGQILVDLSSEDLRRLDLMGPLRFNVYESTLAGVPSLLITACVGVLFPLEPKAVPFVDAQSDFARAFLIEVSKVTPSVFRTISPFVPPVILLWSSFVMGWASLESFDSNSTTRRRSRNGFLYIDGAYGLLAQTLLATAIGLALIDSEHGWGPVLFDDWWRELLIVLIGVLFLTGFVLQNYLVLVKYPRLQFQLNGYEKFGAPESRYYWAVWVFNPISVSL
ncbi:MAG TPA: hypothetical protein VGD64_05640, partial [Acidisarcina sp.]